MLPRVVHCYTKDNHTWHLSCQRLIQTEKTPLIRPREDGKGGQQYQKEKVQNKVNYQRLPSKRLPEGGESQVTIKIPPV